MAADQDETSDGSPVEASTRASILGTVETNPKAYGRWTEDENNRLLDLARSGTSWPAMSTELGRTADAIKSQARRLAFETVHGRSLPDRRTYSRHGKPWSEEELQQLADLVTTASSWDEIGETLQRDPSTCRRRAEAEALEHLINSAAQADTSDLD